MEELYKTTADSFAYEQDEDPYREFDDSASDPKDDTEDDDLKDASDEEEDDEEDPVSDELIE